VNPLARYAYCPFNLDKCYQKPIISASKTVQEVAATTINFLNKDVCSWKLFSAESELYFGRRFNITIDQVVDVDCKVLWGKSIDNLTETIDCSLENKKVINTIPSNATVVIYAIGTSDQAYLGFTYHLIDIIPTTTLLGALGLGLMIIGCAVGCYILFIIRTTSGVKIRKVEGKLKDSATIMTIEMSRARAAFNESQIR
jgi:hypothetical protein